MRARVWMLVLLATRDLLRQRRRAGMAVGILVIGTVAVLLTRGWQKGMLEQIAHEGAGVWLGAVQVHPSDALEKRDAFALTPHVDVTPALVDALRATDGVTVVSPRIRFMARLFARENTNTNLNAITNANANANADEAQGRDGPCFVLASDLATAPRVVPRMFAPERLESGRFPSSEHEILVAAPLAHALGLKAGDAATLLARPVDGGLEGADVVVAGVLRAAFEENQRRAVVVDLRLAQRLLRMEGKATEVLVGVEPLSRAREVAGALDAALAPPTAWQGSLAASAWDEINPRYIAARKIWATTLGVMLFIVVAVAALGISTSLHLVVRERARDVATLAALGLPRRALVLMFLLEGAALGAVGTAGGGALGATLLAVLGARGVSFFPPGGFTITVRPHVSALDLVVALALGVLLSSLVMAWPAWRTASRNPAEHLR